VDSLFVSLKVLSAGETERIYIEDYRESMQCKQGDKWNWFRKRLELTKPNLSKIPHQSKINWRILPLISHLIVFVTCDKNNVMLAMIIIENKLLVSSSVYIKG
jgi:hypothetical protein